MSVRERVRAALGALDLLVDDAKVDALISAVLGSPEERSAQAAVDLGIRRSFWTSAEFLRHKSNCDFLGVMWDQGPCDCGFLTALREMPRDVLEDVAKLSRDVAGTIDHEKRMGRWP